MKISRKLTSTNNDVDMLAFITDINVRAALVTDPTSPSSHTGFSSQEETFTNTSHNNSYDFYFCAEVHPGSASEDLTEGPCLGNRVCGFASMCDSTHS